MHDLGPDLPDCLNFDATGPDGRSMARNHHFEYHREFGGQLLTPFSQAASLACLDSSVKSSHAVFPREGRADEPVEYAVKRLHDGVLVASDGRESLRRTPN